MKARPPTHADVAALFRAMTTKCDHCAGTGRRPLSRVEAETLGACDGTWQTTAEIQAKMTTRVRGPAAANRLSALEALGIVESAPLMSIRPYAEIGDGVRKLWRIRP